MSQRWDSGSANIAILHGQLDCYHDVSPLYAKAGFVEFTSIPAREWCTTDPFWAYDRNRCMQDNASGGLMDMVYVVSERGAAALAEHTASYPGQPQATLPVVSE